MAGKSVIGALRVMLGMDSAAFEKGLKSSQGKLQKFGKFAARGMLAVGAAATAAAGGIALAVRGTINTADEMAKASKKIGIPIEELSRLRHAANLSGVSFAQLQTGVKRLSQNMNDAAQGVGEGAAAFEQLGIDVTNADGSLKSASQVMSEMADRFAEMPDGARKTALAMDIMGRSGADMIPMLNGGSEALNKLLSEADQFGQVFTEEMGAQAEAFNDNMTRLKGAFAALAASLTKELLPFLVQFSEWMVQNAPAISKAIGDEIRNIQAFFQSIAEIYARLEQAFNQVIAQIQGIVQRVETIAAQIVDAFAAIPGQMIEIGIQIIEGLWQGIQQKWEQVKASVADLGNEIVGGIKGALGIRSPSRVMYAVGVDTMEGLALGMESMAHRIDAIVDDSSSGIQGAFQNIGSQIAGLISGTSTWRDVLSSVLQQLTQALFSAQSLQSVFGGGGFGGLLSGLFGGLFGFAQGGSFQVGGAGGIDSQIVAFRASPSETVSVTKPGQMAGGGEMMLGIRVLPDKDGFHAFMVDTADGRIREAAPAIAQGAVGQVQANLPGMITDYEERMR